jgi:poly(A) polymerase
MRLPRADWQERPGLARLLDVLGADAGESRYVGGCVRDALLGMPVNDIDLATRLQPPEVVERLLRAGIKAVPTGIAHGTVTAVTEGGPVEVTTLRRDVSTDGRRATIAYTDDWREDAARRDFTVNALSAAPREGTLYDYFNGLADLEARRIRFIGDPLQRIAEDHLRILRFFRFHARFGAGEPDAAALEACALRANDLMALSRERIADELLKLLALPNPGATIEIMRAQGIFRPVLPEIGAEGAERLARLIGRERETGVAADPVRRLAALLPADPLLAEEIASRLRLSNEAKRRLRLAADRSAWRGGSPWQRSHGIGAEAAIDRLLLGDDPTERVREQADALSAGGAPLPRLKGSDLIAMGIPKGPLVARTLQAVQRQWVEEDFPSAEREREIARGLVDQLLRERQ